MKRLIIYIFCVFVMAGGESWSFELDQRNMKDFLSKIVSSLVSSNPSHSQDIIDQTDKLNEAIDNGKLIQVADNLLELAKTYKAKSSVTISASNGDGALVKYQTLGERMRRTQPITGNKQTVTVENLYKGLYHIWVERGGNPTSDTNNVFAIADAKVSICLDENL